jgi:[acyl-carrier-protein] S-malonyltransferase
MLALLFPGQASQEVGMGLDVFESSSAARHVFLEADEALGMPLSKICFEGPEEELRRTEIQQPAILTTSIALLRALEEKLGKIRPGYVGGHSLGEYSALVAAGAFGFADAVRTVRLRGRLMQGAVADGEGAMAAVIGLSAEAVEAACEHAQRESGLVATPANYNSPAQIVIAGDAKAVELACQEATRQGAKKTVELAVSAPFHCALMEPAARKLEVELARLTFSDANPPVITNVEAEPNTQAARIPGLLRTQVTAPVRFADMIARMKSLGVDGFLEVGPGRVLSGLIARIERRARRANFSSLENLEDVRDFMQSENNEAAN